MTLALSGGRRVRVVGVVASSGDLDRALRMRIQPDLFELRLDRLTSVLDKVEKILPNLRTPVIITARHAREGGAGQLSARKRRELLTRFLEHAQYLDVELRSAGALRAVLARAKRKSIRRIISFHNFKSTPTVRVLAGKARAARVHHADIFKLATRTDTPPELGRLIEFARSNRMDLPLAIMGIGKLGAISRVLLTRAGSVLIYASVGGSTDIEGQLSLQQLRELGFGRRKRNRRGRMQSRALRFAVRH